MEGEGKREVPRYRKSSTRKANRLRNSSSSLPSPTCQKFSNRTILPDSLTYSTHEFLTSSPTGKTRRRKYRDLSFRPILPLCKRIPKVRGSRGVDEGEGEKIPRRGTKPSSHHCVDTILTFVTRVWISLQRLGRREKREFSKGDSSDSSWSTSSPFPPVKERGDEKQREREQRKTNCGGRCAPSTPLLHPLHTLSSSSQPVNQPPLIACGYYRGTTGGAIILTLYPLHPIKPPPPFLIFTYFTVWTNFLPSFLLLFILHLLFRRCLNFTDSEFR